MIWFLPSPFSKLSLFPSLPVCRRRTFLGGGAKSYDMTARNPGLIRFGCPSQRINLDPFSNKFFPEEQFIPKLKGKWKVSNGSVFASLTFVCVQSTVSWLTLDQYRRHTRI